MSLGETLFYVFRGNVVRGNVVRGKDVVPIKSQISLSGIVHIEVIVCSNGTEDRWFKSRQGARFLGLYTLQYCS
jgi:hypothetical protein